jgi:hypothetical protein
MIYERFDTQPGPSVDLGGGQNPIEPERAPPRSSNGREAAAGGEEASAAKRAEA